MAAGGSGRCRRPWVRGMAIPISATTAKNTPVPSTRVTSRTTVMPLIVMSIGAGTPSVPSRRWPQSAAMIVSLHPVSLFLKPPQHHSPLIPTVYPLFSQHPRSPKVPTKHGPHPPPFNSPQPRMSRPHLPGRGLPRHQHPRQPPLRGTHLPPQGVPDAQIPVEPRVRRPHLRRAGLRAAAQAPARQRGVRGAHVPGRGLLPRADGRVGAPVLPGPHLQVGL